MNTNEPQLHRSAQPYFPDGDVVLRAAASEGVHLFRVHKHLLKHHSVAFNDMFHVEDGSFSDTYDGVPVVDMPGDRAEDLALLLSYVYHPTQLGQLSFKRFDPDKALKVSGVIRLADKYLLEPLHDHLVQEVASDWPTTLEEWGVRNAELQAIRNVIFMQKTTKVSRFIPEPVSAILFAQEFGCPQILPSAFYQLAQINFKDTWDTLDREVSLFDWDAQRINNTPVARWSLLEKDNLVRCLHGFQSIDDFRPEEHFLLSEHCFPTRERPDEDDYDVLRKQSKCYAYLCELVKVVWGKGGRRNPLQLLLECLDYEKYPELSKERFPEGLCGHCRESLPTEIARERGQVWRSLPRYFMLE
ncbi:hypothetical protein OH76DRAFT_204983 [Lentinus brumalis]|uniref:BTB domain-containing protein n=1 Tax=Lentinus brumalis TaxID=2498619 RepID=A0A371DIF2_9APHY|nr:hypothetical protein OH76DRAFT_204983 [Polyporus brumalis]